MIMRICSGISTKWLLIHCFQFKLKFRIILYIYIALKLKGVQNYILFTSMPPEIDNVLRGSEIRFVHSASYQESRQTAQLHVIPIRLVPKYFIKLCDKTMLFSDETPGCQVNFISGSLEKSATKLRAAFLFSKICRNNAAKQVSRYEKRDHARNLACDRSWTANYIHTSPIKAEEQHPQTEIPYRTLGIIVL